jgi:hypothetical protein
LSTNSLINDSPLNQLIPNLKNDSNLKKLAEEKKLKIIRGRFDSNEDKILKNNWNKFCDQFNVNEDMKIYLLGYFARSHRYSKEERKKLRDFIRRENFLLRLANGLPNRLIKVIYDSHSFILSLKTNQ